MEYIKLVVHVRYSIQRDTKINTNYTSEHLINVLFFFFCLNFLRINVSESILQCLVFV